MEPITVVLPPDGVKVIGIMQFVHGMCEHRKRYNHVLDYFSKRGYICAIPDIRGHGEYITTKEDLGYFSSKGYKLLIQDVSTFNSYLRKVYPGLPIILIGHSMGALISRAFLKHHSKEIDALVLCGLPSERSGASAGKALIHFMAFFRSWRYRSPFLHRMIVGRFEKSFFKEGRKNAWLSNDGDITDAYNKDPLCGFVYTLNGYKAILNLMNSAHSKEGWKQKNPDLPIMFISGGDDPCRIDDKQWHAAVKSLKGVGYENVVSKMYPGMRHELFNEIGKEEVFEDIIKFLEYKVGIEHDIY